MTPIKEYIASLMVGKRFHFKCDCLFAIDFVGTIKSYKIDNGQIIFLVEHNSKIISIDENHPKMKIEEV